MGDVLYEERPSWSTCFEVDAGSGDGKIRLAQFDTGTFQLQSRLRYSGLTGLESRGFSDELMEDIRCVSPQRLPETDLASVPGWFRWFSNSYGDHTPAALVHDRLIIGDHAGTSVAGLSAQDADRYFRFMLRELGLPFTRRWVMWAAVAFRTRFYDGIVRKLSVLGWIFLALCGVTLLIVGVLQSNWLFVSASLLLPLPAALLWGKQLGAGLVAAYFGFPWIFPPTAVVAVFYGLYLCVEKIASWVEKVKTRLW